MCELLGMSFNEPVKPKISFTGFRSKGKNNPHGWGLAFYPDESAQVFKEPIKADKSPLAEFLENYEKVNSKIFIAHVREMSVKMRNRPDSRSHKNTHPFYRELNGKEYVFAYNGSMKNHKSKLKLDRFQPIGITPAEYAFCYLLSCIAERGITFWSDADFNWLSDKLHMINKINNEVKCNCIFSDGTLLFCYHDHQKYKGLYFFNRKPPYSSIKLKDEDFDIDIVPLGDIKSPSEKGFIIATKPLTNENWQSFNAGELIVFKEGNMIFSSYNRPEVVSVEKGIV